MRDFVRILFGLFFIGMALINMRVTMNDPALYEEFITEDTALLPFYNTLWQDIVVPAMPFFLVLLVLFEIGVGILILNRGRYVRVGLIAGAIFTLVLAPASVYSLLNLVLVGMLVWLLMADYPRSFWQEIRRV